MRIQPNTANLPAIPQATERPAAGGGVDGLDFIGTLERARESEQASLESAERFAAGDPAVGIHEVMIASERATILTRYAVTLKNRAIEAYKELINTPL